jgi:hypothetical protein
MKHCKERGGEFCSSINVWVGVFDLFSMKLFDAKHVKTSKRVVKIISQRRMNRFQDLIILQDLYRGSIQT